MLGYIILILICILSFLIFEFLRISKKYTEYIELKKRNTVWDLYLVSPREFEILMSGLLSNLGFKNVRVTSATNDYGRDIIATKDNLTYSIECKRFHPNKKVGRPLLMKLEGSRSATQTNQAMFITTSSYTNTALAFAERTNMQLINGKDLANLITQLPDKYSLSNPIDNFIYQRLFKFVIRV